MKDIGKTIKETRLKKGLTIKELSEKCDCAYGTIINVEAGRAVTLSVIKKICEVLDLQIEVK